MRTRYVYRSRLLRLITPRWVRGMTLYPFILFREHKDAVTPILVAHEQHHIEQVRRMGWLKFYALYLWYQMKYGYRDNPLEVEARQATEGVVQ